MMLLEERLRAKYKLRDQDHPGFLVGRDGKYYVYFSQAEGFIKITDEGVIESLNYIREMHGV